MCSASRFKGIPMNLNALKYYLDINRYWQFSSFTFLLSCTLCEFHVMIELVSWAFMPVNFNREVSVYGKT